jgi:hypothetical protein
VELPSETISVRLSSIGARNAGCRSFSAVAVARVKAVLRAARRETLVHFAVAGGLLFALDAIRAKPGQESISVTRQIADGLVRARQELTGNPVSAAERPALIAAYVADEVLLREAYARELHRRDGLLRKRLLELMRFLLLEEPPEPTESDLQTYLQAHADVYQTPPALTFSHVYFSGEESTTPRDADGVLERLLAGGDFRKLGEHFWLGHRLEAYSEPNLVQLFGPDFTKTVLKLPSGRWSGPIASTRGVHFVRVDEHRPSAMPALADLAPLLRADWLASKREELLQRKVDELSKKYRIEIEPGVED